MSVCVCVCACACMYVCVYAHMLCERVHVRVRVRVHVHVHVHVRACTCVHMPTCSVRVCCAYANVVNQRLSKNLLQNTNRGIATVCVLICNTGCIFYDAKFILLLTRKKSTDVMETLALAVV